MAYLPSLPADAVLLDVFRAYPDTARPLLDYHQLVMRGPSPLSVAEREFIAAYVSGLNSCTYCHDIHTVTAQACGVRAGAVPAAIADPDTADSRLAALLRYVGKLTRTPSEVTATDAAAVFDAGWEERALHDAVLVCALFNFMNRMVDGLGITADPDYIATSGTRLHEVGYAGLGPLLISALSDKDSDPGSP